MLSKAEFLAQYNDVFGLSKDKGFDDSELRTHIEKLREFDVILPHNSTFFAVVNSQTKSFEYISKNFKNCLGLDPNEFLTNGLNAWFAHFDPDKMDTKKFLKILESVFAILGTIALKTKAENMLMWFKITLLCISIQTENPL